MNNIGLPDSAFIRGNVPMTKAEIRALTIVKMQLQDDDVVWDIGAGTGSISIEAALNLKKGKVYSIEKNVRALELIEKNKTKFNCTNINIISGTAPAIFAQIPSPTKAVIGGSGGNLAQILEYLWFQTKVEKIVINCVTLNSANQAIKTLQSFQAAIDASQVSVNKIKLIKDLQMLESQNPIFIICGSRLGGT